MILSSLLFMLGLVSFGFLISTYCGVEEKYAPLISVSTFICLGVCFGILNVLSVGVGLLYAILLIGGAIVIYKRRQEFCKYFFSLPIFCFVTSWIFMVILFSIKQPFFTSWDEFSHWGPFLKNIKETGALHIYADRYFIHQTYVQGMPIFYYISSFFDNMYREESVYLAYSILMHACAVTVIPNVSINKKWKNSLVYILFIPFFWYLFPYAYYAAPYTCSYLDVVLGALFAGTMLYVINNLHTEMWSAKKVWTIGVLFFSILQIKDISIAFYLICLATGSLNLLWLILKEKKGSNNKIRMILMHIVFAIIIPFSGKVAWSTILERTGKNIDQFDGSTVDKVLELYGGYVNGENDYFGQVLSAYMDGLKSVSISWTHIIIPIIVVALVVVSFVLGYSNRKLRKNNLEGVYLAFFPIYFLCYLLVLFVVYLCSMSAEEALSNASMDRYVACFVSGWAMILFGLVLKGLYEYEEKIAIGLVALSTVFIYMSIPFSNINFWNLTKEETGLEWYESKSEACMETMEAGSNIWFVRSGDENWILHYTFAYTMMPNVVNLSLPVDDTNYSATEMIQMAKDNGIEYFFVMDSNQKFKEKFGKYIVYKNDAGDERCMVMKLTEESTLEQVY